MAKKVQEKEVKLPKRETRTIEIGTTGLSSLSITLLPDGNIYLQERFRDPNANGVKDSVFNVAMYVRKEHISSLLSILLSSGFTPDE